MFILEELYTCKPRNIKHLISVTASFYLEAQVGLGLQLCSDQDFPSLHQHLVLLKTQVQPVKQLCNPLLITNP